MVEGIVLGCTTNFVYMSISVQTVGKIYSDMYYLIFLWACILKKMYLQCLQFVAKRTGDFIHTWESHMWEKSLKHKCRKLSFYDCCASVFSRMYFSKDVLILNKM